MTSLLQKQVGLSLTEGQSVAIRGESREFLTLRIGERAPLILFQEATPSPLLGADHPAPGYSPENVVAQARKRL